MGKTKEAPIAVEVQDVAGRRVMVPADAWAQEELAALPRGVRFHVYITIAKSAVDDEHGRLRPDTPIRVRGRGNDASVGAASTDRWTARRHPPRARPRCRPSRRWSHASEMMNSPVWAMVHLMLTLSPLAAKS